MKTIQNEHFKNYLTIREQVDKSAHSLEKLHKKHLKCKAGCDMCCMDYSIFPVEYYTILEQLKDDNFDTNTAEKNSNKCIFLKNHQCVIYKNRPIICRTHGLPLLYTNEEGEWELSACELNFVDYDFGEFSIDTTFQQDKFNSMLFVLNQKFISNFSKIKYNKFDLVPVKQLISDLKQLINT